MGVIIFSRFFIMFSSGLLERDLSKGNHVILYPLENLLSYPVSRIWHNILFIIQENLLEARNCHSD